MDKSEPTMNLDGVNHRFRVFPNANNTGWLFETWNMGESTLVNVPTELAKELAVMLAEGPGEPEWDCVEHKKIGVCLKCLM